MNVCRIPKPVEQELLQQWDWPKVFHNTAYKYFMCIAHWEFCCSTCLKKFKPGYYIYNSGPIIGRICNICTIFEKHCKCNHPVESFDDYFDGYSICRRHKVASCEICTANCPPGHHYSKYDLTYKFPYCNKCYFVVFLEDDGNNLCKCTPQTQYIKEES